MCFGGWQGLKYFKYHFQFYVDKDLYLAERNMYFFYFQYQENCGDFVAFCLKSHFPLNCDTSIMPEICFLRDTHLY